MRTPAARVQPLDSADRSIFESLADHIDGGRVRDRATGLLSVENPATGEVVRP